MAEKMTDEQRELVEKNIDLAHHLALSAWRLAPHTQEKDEVVASAYEGLVNAAIKFDPSKADVVDGVPDLSGAFAGYARQKINGSIMDGQRKRDYVPRRTRRAYKELIAEGYGSGRSPQELSDLTGMSVEKVRLIISAVEHSPVSLTPADEGDGKTSGSAGFTTEVRDRREVEDQALESQIKDAVVGVFDGLDDLQQVVIALRYYSGLDLTAISSLIDVKLSHVRSAHTEGLLALHSAMVYMAS